ncbi:MAG: FAD-dependent oxidoreductase [Monoglobales bacterium]
MYDVIVAGGGFAGFSAAVAAARQGQKVLLFDKGNSLGGAASNGLVMPFMHHETNVDGKPFYLNRGIFAEVKTALEAESDIIKRWSFHFHDEALKYIMNKIAIDAGVRLLYGVYLTGVDMDGDAIKSVTLAGVSGPLTLQAKYFIDATGDGLLSVLAGCDYQLGRESDSLCQPMTLCFRVANVDSALYNEQKGEINSLYKKLHAEGKFKNPREDVLAFLMPFEGIIHFNTTRVVRKNPTDPFEKTDAEIMAREQVFEMFAFLKENFSAFKNSQIISTAAEIGVRESRMIECDYRLTVDDLKNCAKFPDAIAAANYDIDIHNPEGAGTSHYFFEDGTWYTIPYRSIHPKEKKNLLVAGRCICSDHESQASYRIMPIVSSIGEAAGIAVSVAAQDNLPVADANIEKIQKIITETGGFTGLV